MSTKQIKVIGIGLPRTGTTSLKNALEILGFTPCYHITETVMHNREFNHNHVFKWVDAFNRETSEPIPWDELLQHYQAACDYPTSPYFEELFKQYPAAKYVLTLRPEAEWLKSYKVLRHNHRHVRRFAPIFQRAKKLMEMIEHLDSKLYGADQSDENLLRVFKEYNQKAENLIPAEQLLVLQPGDGWEPLCEFLQVEVPDLPYPRSNEGASLGRRIPRALAAAMRGKSKDMETLLNYKSKDEVTID